MPNMYYNSYLNSYVSRYLKACQRLSYDFIYLVSSGCGSLSYFLMFLCFFYLGILLLQSAKGAKAHNVAAAAVASDGPPVTKEGEEKIKMHTHSYCCLDYAQVHFRNLCH
jgi:hypothetical protein